MLPTWGIVLAVAGGWNAAIPQDTLRYHAVMVAEDARPEALSGLGPLFEAMGSTDLTLVRLAVRGLGRQERADLIDSLVPALAHADPAIRAEAANAIGQSALRERTAEARRVLEDRIALEPHPVALGAILRTLGRLPVASDAERRRTEALLVRLLGRPVTDTSGAVLEGSAHGLQSLYRRAQGDPDPTSAAIERLVELLAPRHREAVRRLAMAALAVSQHTDSGILLEALADSSREVRRSALFAAFNQAALPGRERVVRRAWRDPDPGVRYEAVRAFARHMAATEGCAPILSALDDSDAQVRLLAIDLLAGCGAVAAARLAGIAGEEPLDRAWHAPAHALVALAQVAPDQADVRIPVAAGSPVWWARLYAARAAGQTRNLSVLTRLARDPHPNVREAALDALERLVGHDADSLYVAALSSPDYQLVRTAALALDSTPDRTALGPLIESLQRISRERRETSRDTRAALLTAIGTLGGPATVPELRPYLSDFDPAIAAQAADLIGRWTGRPAAASPRPLAHAPVPTWGALARMNATRLSFVMQDGGRVVLELRPYDAPTNVARLVRMARDGWFNRLTFHRIAPNYVLQGGSPGANEYVGDAGFTRDELGLGSHRRGTVGISTRGRDTGDGQIFFNLIDNYRLDHNYTILAEVVEGMEVVDRMLEGAVIERVEVLPR